MKIGILTYHFANNYGAMLQAFSLQTVLKELNIDTEFIDYQTRIQKSNNSIFSQIKTPKDAIKNIMRIFHYGEIKNRIKSFNEFRNNYLKKSDKTFSTPTEVLEYIDSHFDAIIVGSDQVWNPKTFDFDGIYFTIVESKIPIYVYAASLGTATEKEIRQYKNYLPLFSAISVREKSSETILKKINPYLKIKTVLDPTLLIEATKLKELAQYKKSKKSKYILCYYLGREDSFFFRLTVKKLAKKLGLKTYFINVNSGLTSFLPDLINDCSVEEFLGYIQNADLVCTNSFHAVAISIKLHIPFYSFEKSESNDSRKIDLLNELGLQDRIIYDFDISNIGNHKIEYTSDSKIQKLQNESASFLKEITYGQIPNLPNSIQ